MGSDVSAMTYTEALNLLVEQSGWKRADVVKDGESAAWFIAQQAQRAGVIVAKGRPQ